MKKNSRPLLGTIAFVLGLVLAMTGVLLFAEKAPATTRELEQARANAERSQMNARNMCVSRAAELLSYYQTAQGKNPENTSYQDRIGYLNALTAEMNGGMPLSQESFDHFHNIVSLDGDEVEITTLNNLQNQLLILWNVQSTLAAEPDEAADEAAPASHRPLGIGLMCAGLLLAAAGLILNHGYRTRKALSQFFLYLLLTVGAVIMVFPFYWMITSSLKWRVEVSRFPPQFLPNNPFNFDNYRIAFQQAPFAQYFLNSIIVCVCSVGIVTVTTILAAFAFSRLQFPGREFIFSALLSMMMLPFEMLVITNYSTIIHLNLNDTRTALVIPFISSIFYTYIMRNFFASIPESLYWSARVDGCSNWRYLWKVMVPIGKPSLVTVILLNALASWNSFMWPLLVVKTKVNRTLPFGLYAFTTEAGAYQELIMAASTVVVLPMIVLFLFARKQILQGVARGGLKG